MEALVALMQALVVGSLALFGIVLTQSWTTRREYSKRRIEFAEEVLALFYEVRDAFRFIGIRRMGWRGQHAAACRARNRERGSDPG